jgi:hypothetical protein
MNRKLIPYVVSSGLIYLLTIFAFYGCGNNNYEMKKLDKGELYYNNTVSQEKVVSLGNYINQCAVFTDGINKARITKKDSIYELSLSVPPDKINSSSYQEYTEILATQLSEDVFDHSPVKIHLTDENFNSKVTESSSKSME